MMRNDDNRIMTGVFDAVYAKTGLYPIKEPPKGSETDTTDSSGRQTVKDGAYILYQRTGNVDVSMFVKTLSLNFTAVSPKFSGAHNNGNSIIDAVTQWVDDGNGNVLGRPVSNGMNDDTDGTGNYLCLVDVQISYIPEDGD